MADFSGLEAFLDRTHAALIAGNLPDLSDLAGGVEALLATAGTCDRALANRLALKAQQNERLLASAVSGVKSARRRVQDFTDAGRFSTYGPGGQRNQHGLSQPAAARRA